MGTVPGEKDDGKTQFLSKLKNEFRNSPLASNVLLGLILTGLEKFIDMEFPCPCNPKWNASFASVYFIFPGVIASVLMLFIQGFRCNACIELEKILIVLVPAIMWLVLVFLDGEYYACAKTSWSGRYVIVDKGEPQRWCEPTNSTSYMERMSLTQQWYVLSQVIGFGVLLGCLVPLVLFKCYKVFNQRPEGEDIPLVVTPQEDEEQGLLGQQ